MPRPGGANARVRAVLSHHRRIQGCFPGGASGRQAPGATRLDHQRARHAPEERARRARQGAQPARAHVLDRGRRQRGGGRALHDRRAGDRDDPARRALRQREHDSRHLDGRQGADLVHDRAAEPGEGQGPEGLAALDGALRGAAARRVRHPARALGGARRRQADPRVLPQEPRAEGTRRGARGPGDRVMMKPEEILTLIAAARGTAICVPTMTTSPAWRTIAPGDLSVGCVGFMGGASAMGLGLALGAPDRRVIVFDGDGSLLMQLGSLATIAGAAPRNLTHLLFKNGVYHTSGSQETPGGEGVDFAAMAKAAGYRSALTINTLEDFKKRLPGLLSDDGPIMAQLITGLADSTPMNSPPGTPFHQQVSTLREKVAGAK